MKWRVLRVANWARRALAIPAICTSRISTGRPADYSDGHLFSDTDPVPAVGELRDGGAVGHIPATRLVDEPTTVGDIYRPKV